MILYLLTIVLPTVAFLGWRIRVIDKANRRDNQRRAWVDRQLRQRRQFDADHRLHR